MEIYLKMIFSTFQKLLDPLVEPFRFNLMQMDSHMVASVWTNLEHSQGVNYRLVATDKVRNIIEVCLFHTLTD